MTNKILLYAGTYTHLLPHLVSANGKGVYVYELDLESGRLTAQSKVGRLENPSFVTVSPNGETLYVASEIDQSQPSGLTVYAIAPEDGSLSLINSVEAKGSSPCYISVDGTGRFALISNYSSGTVCMFPIRPDGGLEPASDMVQHSGTGPNADRQEGPHAHCIVIDPNNRYAFAADLGADKIFGYRLDLRDGKLIPNGDLDLAPGSGPRHIVFHPNGRLTFVIQELSSEITALAYDSENGQFEIIERVSTLPADFAGESHCADIHVSPDGRFLYGSNRGHDSIVIYRVDQTSGRLTLIGFESTQGSVPRNFAIDPTGTFLLAANQDSDTVVTFRIDQQTGELQDIGQIAKVPTPVCLKFGRV